MKIEPWSPKVDTAEKVAMGTYQKLKSLAYGKAKQSEMSPSHKCGET